MAQEGDTTAKVAENEVISLMLVGGGTRFPAFIGALQAIEEKGLRLGKIVGSSTGGIVAALYASGKSPAEIYRKALNLDIGMFKDFSLKALFRRYGLYSGDRLEQWLDRELEGKSFGDRLRVPLEIYATEMLQYQPLVFTSEKFPHLKISTAATCSTMVPWVFGYRPLQVGDSRYALVDGSLMSGVMERGLNRSSKTLILKVASKRTLNHPHHEKLRLRDYFTEMLTFSMHAHEKEFMKGGKWKDTILLFCADISPTRFQLTQQEITFLYEQGYEQTMKYLEYKWGI